MANVRLRVSLMLGLYKVQFSDLCFFYLYKRSKGSLQPNLKFFADDTSLFKLINDPSGTTKQLREDLDKITESTFQMKISFSPDPPKQGHEVIFTRKMKKVVYPAIFLITNQLNKFYHKNT